MIKAPQQTCSFLFKTVAKAFFSALSQSISFLLDWIIELSVLWDQVMTVLSQTFLKTLKQTEVVAYSDLKYKLWVFWSSDLINCVLNRMLSKISFLQAHISTVLPTWLKHRISLALNQRDLIKNRDDFAEAVHTNKSQVQGFGYQLGIRLLSDQNN